MTSFLRYPEPAPMSAAAASRPRDASGRVLMPIRAEVKLHGGPGFRRYFSTWPEVTEWLASDDFASVAPAVRSIAIVCPRPDPRPGPEAA